MTHTVAILTGASRGIGAAMARQLAKPGTRLITLARREDPELAAHARAQDAQLEQLAVDLSDLRAAEQAAERICAALPRDAKRYLLINNAGTVHPVSGTDALIDGQAIASAFNLNVTAVMLLTARFLAAVEDLPGRPPRAEHLVRRGPQSQRRLGRVLRHQGGAGHVLARGQAGTGRDRRARRLAGARHR